MIRARFYVGARHRRATTHAALRIAGITGATVTAGEGLWCGHWERSFVVEALLPSEARVQDAAHALRTYYRQDVVLFTTEHVATGQVPHA